MRPKFKDVPTSDGDYRVGRLNAFNGSWISVLLTERLREAKETEARSLLNTPTVSRGDPPAATPTPKAPALTPEAGFMMTAHFLISKLNRAELADVQLACLQVCSKIEPGGPLPVIVDENRWAYEEMEFDAPLVMELTKQALAFNIARFFPEAGSNAAPATPADSSQ